MSKQLQTKPVEEMKARIAAEPTYWETYGVPIGHTTLYNLRIALYPLWVGAEGGHDL